MLCAVTTVWADENVTKAQDRLRTEGFYRGQSTGTYDSETAAAVTRFQIRNGLAISGKLDAATAKALGVGPAEQKSESQTLPGTWRRMRNGDLQFEPQTANSAQPTQASAAPAITPEQTVAAPPPNTAAPSSDPDRERLRDYVAAFILAGIDPQIGSELEFFATNVNYFGRPNISRDLIRQDLIRYDREWPDRRFWLEGDIQVERDAGNAIKVAFPLRYELRNGSRHASGKVSKTLTLFKGNNNQLEIIAVDETKK